MKKIILLITIISLTSCSLFQKKSANSNMEVLKKSIDKAAEFPGGTAKMTNFLIKNIRYPKEAKEKGIQGKVHAQFFVEKDGSLSDIRIIKGIGKSCDQEVIRLIKLMPKWTPETQKGKKVRTKFTLPINFTLR